MKYICSLIPSLYERREASSSLRCGEGLSVYGCDAVESAKRKVVFFACKFVLKQQLNSEI